MTRLLACAAAAAAFIALALPGTAQARMANPGLNSAVPSTVQDAHYRPYRHYHNRRYQRRHVNRYRHCWNQRVRVRVAGGHIVWRTHRRCAWRYR
ncbi:MAG: hypothetical protein ACK4UO_00910 [Pseudolabrys sp.]